jgi:uncharacterized C2H2 Zn-finger protein
MPFLGYAFQCPKCNGYVIYIKEYDRYVNISEGEYNIFSKAGQRLHEKAWNTDMEE